MRKLTLGVIGVVVAVMTAACAADLQPSPTTTTPLPKAGAPATLELAISPGIGDQGGTATIGVHVLDAFGAPVVNLLVALTSTSGTMTPDQITTNEAGRGTATLVAAPGSVTVTASIANGPTRSAPVAVQPLPSPPPPPTSEPAPPAPAPEPPPPPLTVTMFVTPRQAGLATNFSLATQAIASAAWDFGDGSTATTAEPFTTHVYANAGSYTATVIVRDTRGRTASTSSTVTIAAAPAPPPPSAQAMVITLKPSATSVAVGGTLTYTASVDNLNIASGETVIAYQWDLDGSGTAEFTSTGPTHTSNAYTTAGIVTPRVTVTTNQRVGSATTTIVVTN
jgi:PKD repeat protein